MSVGRRLGFTFVEVVMVVALLGVIAVSAYPLYYNLVGDAWKATEDGTVGAVRVGTSTYGSQSDLLGRTPKYPATLDSATHGNASVSNPFFSNVLDPSVTSDWSKTGLVYTGPADNAYTYNPADGTFTIVVNPLGYVYGWSMDEGSGNEIGNEDFTGTFHGADWTDGKVGTALRFDGVEGHARIPDNDALDLTTAGTVQSWISIDSFTNPFGGVIHKGDNGDFSDESYTLQFWTGNRLILGLWDDSNQFHTVQSTTVFEPGQWYHVAGVWDDTGMRIYVNGQLEATNPTSVTARNSSGGLNIGAQTNEDHNLGWHNLPFSGKIDEGRIFDRSLTGAEIQSYYNSTK